MPRMRELLLGLSSNNGGSRLGASFEKGAIGSEPSKPSEVRQCSGLCPVEDTAREDVEGLLSCEEPSGVLVVVHELDNRSGWTVIGGGRMGHALFLREGVKMLSLADPERERCGGCCCCGEANPSPPLLEFCSSVH